MAAVRKFLDLSTAHLDEEDRRLLDLFSVPDSKVGPMAVNTIYGWFMWAAEDCYEDNNLSENLIRICKHARKHRCDYVLFDSDADIDDELPVFEDVSA